MNGQAQAGDRLHRLQGTPDYLFLVATGVELYVYLYNECNE